MKRLSSSVLLALVVALSAAFVVTAVATPEAHAQTKKKKKKKKKKATKKARPIAGVRAGLALFGTGNLEGGGQSLAVTDKTQFGFNTFIAFPIVPKLRAGLSLWFLPTNDYKLTDSTNTTDDNITNSWLDINVYAEYLLKLGPVYGYGFGEGGYTMVFPGKPEGAMGEPDNWTGFNAQGGLGVRFSVSPGFRLRGEGRFGFYQLTIPSFNNSIEQTLVGQRALAAIGADFSL